MRIMRRPARGERGAAAVEFALVMPILLFLVFGIIDFGMLVNQYAQASNAAREGARAASLGEKSGSVVATVEGYLAANPLAPDTVEVTVTCKTPEKGSCANFDSGATTGGTAIVKVVTHKGWFTPLGMMFTDDMTVTKTSQMRIE